VGHGGEQLVGTAPAGHAVHAFLVQPVEVGIRGELRVKQARVGPRASPLLPRGDKREPRVMVLRLPQLPLGRATDPGSRIVGQQGQQPLGTTAACGDVGLLPQGLGAMTRHGMEGQSAGGPGCQAHRPDGVVPQAPEDRRALRGAPATLRGQKGALGQDVEPGKAGQACLKDRAHNRAMPRIPEAC
jgi:hypothetical protein